MSDYGFKFKIGDVVAVVGTSRTNEGISWPMNKRVRWLVVEQGLQVCHGGEQRFYACRGIQPGGDVRTDYIRFAEPELEPSERFAPEKDPPLNDIVTR